MTDAEVKAWQDSRYKVPEGYRMTLWPAFRRLMARLGVPISRINVPDRFKTPGYREQVCIDLPAPDANATVRINDMTMVTDLSSFEAYKLPEFRAYCELLGIPWHAYCISLKIEFADGEFPSYTMRAALAIPKDADPEQG